MQQKQLHFISLQRQYYSEYIKRYIFIQLLVQRIEQEIIGEYIYSLYQYRKTFIYNEQEKKCDGLEKTGEVCSVWTGAVDATNGGSSGNGSLLWDRAKDLAKKYLTKNKILTLKYLTEYDITERKIIGYEVDQLWGLFQQQAKHKGYKYACIVASEKPKGFIIISSKEINYLYKLGTNSEWIQINK